MLLQIHLNFDFYSSHLKHIFDPPFLHVLIFCFCLDSIWFGLNEILWNDFLDESSFSYCNFCAVKPFRRKVSVTWCQFVITTYFQMSTLKQSRRRSPGRAELQAVCARTPRPRVARVDPELWTEGCRLRSRLWASCSRLLRRRRRRASCSGKMRRNKSQRRWTGSRGWWRRGPDPWWRFDEQKLKSVFRARVCWAGRSVFVRLQSHTHWAAFCSSTHSNWTADNTHWGTSHFRSFFTVKAITGCVAGKMSK